MVTVPIAELIVGIVIVAIVVTIVSSVFFYQVGHWDGERRYDEGDRMLVDARAGLRHAEAAIAAAVADLERARETIRSTRTLVDPPGDDEEDEDE
jgi:hypothetical protein